jgi:hypothetical protein
VSTWWWTRKRSYFVFVMRELSSIFVAWFVVYLLMLVSAFAGRERVLAAYHHAIAGRYRFFSYGDAMFVERAIRRTVGGRLGSRTGRDARASRTARSSRPPANATVPPWLAPMSVNTNEPHISTSDP